jgi:3-oxoacyl-[acyl-carrier protein] reductase
MEPVGQVILLSGGSRGLGQAVATELLQHGNIVATFSRCSTPFVQECARNYPDHFLWQAMDATDRERVRGFVRTVVDRFGRVDVLLNNAASGAEGMLTLMREEEVQRTLSLNLEAVVLLTRACLRVMLHQGHGVVVTVTSVLGLRGHAGVAVYSATKAALDGLTRSLAREVGSRGIRVNAIAPGYFESDMVRDLGEGQRRQIVRRTPLARLATPSDIVGAIRFLVSPQAGFITGQTLVVDGGLTC